MTPDRVVSGGLVATHEGFRQLDLVIANGKIVEHQEVGGVHDGAEVLDAKGKLVLPGMIDVHVHAREPGYTHKEDILTCSQAAAAGGVTTLFGMPNVDPPTVTRKDLKEVLGRYEEHSIVDFNHNPAGTRIEEIPSMVDLGIAAFKIYMVVDTGRTYPHPSGTGMHDHGELLKVMECIAETGLPLMVHPHNQEIMNTLEREAWDRDDRSPQAYARTLAAYDGVIWDTAIALLLRLVEATGCRLHIVHVQTRKSVEMIREAKRSGLPVTCEVNHWALFLGRWDDVTRLGPYALSYWVPDDHRKAIWEGIEDGTIDILASDHAPHTREEKEIGWADTWASHTGTPGIQFQVPLLFDAVKRGYLTAERAVELIASRPAEAFRIPGKGSLSPGSDADIVVLDPNETWTISNDVVLSKCGWTPYHGRELTSAVEWTLVRGVDVYGHGRVLGTPGHGLLARPS